MTEPSGTPRIVIAVITSELGILAARCCQLPSWVFPAREVEPGESPGEAGSRCVFDATGLAVTSTWLIDRQARPDCVLDHVHVTVGVPEPQGTEGEGCAQFWWMNAAGVCRAMPELLAPVRFYLRELEARGMASQSPPGDCGRIGGSNLPLCVTIVLVIIMIPRYEVARLGGMKYQTIAQVRAAFYPHMARLLDLDPDELVGWSPPHSRKLCPYCREGKACPDVQAREWLRWLESRSQPS